MNEETRAQKPSRTLFEQAQIEQAQAAAESWSAEQVLQWTFESYGEDVAIASAFGAEGMVTIDIAAQVWPGLRVFILDTSFLFPETHRLIEQIEARYGIKVERTHSLISPDEQAQIYGPELWRHNPDLCCRIRKIEPLRRKLADLRAWVTSIRREQTPARSNASKIEWDSQFLMAKINPLADWTQNKVWDHIRTHQLAYNPLHDRNYPSIGCTHCTRPVEPGDDPRSGRWTGFDKLECGLHSPTPKQ